MSADRGPAPLLPVPLARMVGFALLAGLAGIEWTRMADGLGAGRAVVWVGAALCAAGLVIGAQRVPLRARGPATLAAAAAGLVLAVALSGIELALLKPARWDELGEGLLRGAEALGGVRLPYAGRDPWPREALELSGALLCALSALVAVWPRGRATGYPVVALAALLTLVATPVVSLGGPQPLFLGAAIAALAACFLWLERLPMRPGLGIAVLAGVAIAGALPLGVAADRDEPWFDYRTWAEALGPLDPVSYDWDHEYGPIELPREGVELFRVDAGRPFYWKAQNLSSFDGTRWEESTNADPAGDDPEADLPLDWLERPEWNQRFSVSLRRLETRTVVGAGTILDVPSSSRAVRLDSLRPDEWVAVRGRGLGRGDSYTVEAHVPDPSPAQLNEATAGGDPRRAEALGLRLGFREDALEDPAAPRLPPSPASPDGAPIERAEFRFPAFDSRERPTAEYTTVAVTDDGIAAMRRTSYWRTYQLAQRLKRDASTPYEYVLAVNAHLRRPPFRYTEVPPATDGAPLDDFLAETQQGYCQQYSGAMALLLRMGGVPARVVTGFSPGGFRRKRGEWIVRDTDAHSWVEAYFDGLGWVTFDPTPPGTPARSLVAAIAPPAATEDPEQEVTPAAGDPTARRPEGLTRDQVAAATGTGSDGPSWPLLAGAGAALLALLAAARWFVVRRRRSSRGARPPQPDDLALAELERALRRAGRAAPAGITLTGLEQRLGLSREGAAYLRTLRATRFAATPPAPSPAERAAFRRDLAAGLGWRGKLRALWALPPKVRDRT